MITLFDEALTETLYALWSVIEQYDAGQLEDTNEWNRNALRESYAVLHMEAVKRRLPAVQDLPEVGWI